ncbi:MAG: prepilin-type N-terminal cleavage/methylation domain-containing protein [Candidatus Omnitrophica bacterium]|nr:prepilin-type N-terminal cleavage/methylation domain-containing protein [Candidatus Omnitrophota bacterium]
MNFKNKKRLSNSIGFTLLELVVVLAILGFLTAMTSRIFTNEDDQRRFDETRAQMQEIKKAILGGEGAYANGQRQFAGYVADMGGLPALDAVTNQPEGLWTDDLDSDGTPDLLGWVYNPLPNPPDSMVWMGWRGPYVGTPALRSGEVSGQEKLRDGWGNPLVFDDTTTPGDLIITSPGANGVINAVDTGFDKDIAMIIKQTEYMAPVAGRVRNFDASTEANVTVTIYFPVSGIEPNPDHTISGVPVDGYFRFERGAAGVGTNGTRDIPAGVRHIFVSGIVSGVSVQRAVVFTVEPTGNWLGDINLQ